MTLQIPINQKAAAENAPISEPVSVGTRMPGDGVGSTSRMSTFETLRRIWQELDPSLYEGPEESVLRRLDEHRTEFYWLGTTLIFDARTRTVQPRGNAPVKYDSIRDVAIFEDREASTWTVVLRLEGWWAKVLIGTTREQVDASIAAAHLAKATGKRAHVW